MRKTVCLIAILMLSLGLLWAKDFWKDKPYTEWTQEEARKMVFDSPWARQVRFAQPSAEPLGGPMTPSPGGAAAGTGGGGYGAPGMVGGQQGIGQETSGTGPQGPETVYLVQWYSARTWRQGMARFQQLRGTVSAEEAKKFVDTAPADYIIALTGSDMRAFQTVNEDTLRNVSYLRARRSKRKLQPMRVEIQRAADGQRVSSILFYFPRMVEGQPFVTPDEKGVDFGCEMKAHSIATTFDVRNMKAGNELDL